MIEEKTREEMISKNLPLVHSCARKFKDRGVEYDDLFQSGCIGLIKAVDNFDSTRGFSFSTYAVPVILGEIKRVFRDGGSIKVGRTMKERSRKLMKLRENIINKQGYEPTVSQLAKEAGIEISEVAELINVGTPPSSLSYSDENGECEIDIPINSHEVQISNHIALRQVISQLDERDKMILELRFFHSMTQTQTAKALDMTQVQISRREKVILTLLRKELAG